MDVLLERLRRGEPEAFRETLARYGGPLEAVLRRIVHAEAEDIVQETFARLFQNVNRVRDLRPWLFAVALNLARTHLRRSPSANGELSLRSVADTAELRESIDAAIASLPERTRMAFVLREIGGLSTEEVGKVERCTPEAVRQRLVEARRKLRQSLGPVLERSVP